MEQLLEIERNACAPPPKPIVYDGMSLNDLLVALDNHADPDPLTARPLSDEDLEYANTLLLRKVDGCRGYLDDLEAEAAKHKKYALEHVEAARVIEAQHKRTQDRIVWAMNRANKKELEGVEFKLKLGQPSTVPLLKANAGQAEQYPQFVNVKTKTSTTYDWKLTEIKDAIKSGELAEGVIARLEFEPKFTVNRKDK